MFATIDALAAESWAPRKTLRERARLDGSLLPSDTSGYRDVRRQNHLRPVAYCTSGFDSSAQSTGSPPASARSSFPGDSGMAACLCGRKTGPGGAALLHQGL